MITRSGFKVANTCQEGEINSLESEETVVSVFKPPMTESRAPCVPPEENMFSVSNFRGEEDVRSTSSRSSSRRRVAEEQYKQKLAIIAEQRRLAEVAEEVARAELEADLAKAAAMSASRRSGSNYAASWVGQQGGPEGPCNKATVTSFDYLHPPNVDFAPRTKPVTHLPQSQSQLVVDLSQLLSLTGSRQGTSAPLPQFSGDVGEWLLFKKAFDETRASYSTCENLARLRNSLQGEAKDMVGSLLLVSNNPEDVVRALELYYAQPERIIMNDVRLIRELPRLGRSSKDIIVLATKVRSCVRVMNVLNKTDYLFSPELFNSIYSKLTPLLQEKWLDFAQIRDSSHPKLLLMAEFLECEASKRVRFAPYEGASSSAAAVPGERYTPPARPQVPSRGLYAQAPPARAPFAAVKKVCNNSKTTPVVGTVACPFCEEPTHSVRSCPKFVALAVRDRISWVRGAKICAKCLKNSRHNWRFCKSRCDICGGNHNAILHINSPSNVIISDVTPVSQQCQSEKYIPEAKEVDVVKNNTLYFSESFKKGQFILKIVPVVVSGPKGDRETFALLDDGSTVTMIDLDLADELGLVGREDLVSIESFIGNHNAVNSKLVNFNIRGKNCSKVFKISSARAIPSFSLSPQSVLDSDINIKALPHLADIAAELTYTDARPKILIGVCDWHLLLARESRLGKLSEPAAVRTELGWALYGALNRFSRPIASINNCKISIAREQELDLLIRQHYDLENLGVKTVEPYNDTEKRALKILEETTRRLPNGRFEVGLPWREDDPSIPDSFSHAMSRFRSLDRRFKKDKSYFDLYKLNIEAYVEKDYAEECLDSHQNRAYDSRRWYLPHFGVTHPHKPGKLRIVHDAAAHSGGFSLNSLLLPGPDLLQSLLGILLRFREGGVALAGDIREMFPQIKIREADRDCQRYLWYSDGPGSSVREFRMSSLIFGATSSPFTAIYIKNRNASEMSGQFPEAARAIIEDHYMDDFLGSTDTVEEAANLAADVFHVHSMCGFQMREWVSNKREALARIPEELVKQGFTDINLDLTKSTVRVLGLIWNPHNDTFSFNVDLSPPSSLALTKRQVLRDLMRIYDPLGFLGPFVSKGKILFQRTWRLALGWDDFLPQEDCALWFEWYEQMALIQGVSIPRCYALGFSLPLVRELHVFVDASSEAYASCIYWRIVDSTGNVKISFVISKSRVAPLKPTTIPRLELQAALLGARLAVTVCSACRYKPVRRVFWTDSQIVLSWIRRDPIVFKTFVANRLSEISEITSKSEWRWVPTLMNVADDATRSEVKGVNCLGRWLTGPQFLLKADSEWPKELLDESDSSAVPELKCNELVVSRERVACTLTPDPGRFSSWVRLLRATARVHQFLRILKLKTSSNFQTRQGPHPLLARDIWSAEEHLLRASQAKYFDSELKAAEDGRPFPLSSRLKNFKAKIDERGLLVLDSRIKGCLNVPESLKVPIVLDGRCHIVRLMIHYYHEWAGHGHNEAVVNELRQRFYILRLRPTVRSVAASCLKCRIRKALPVAPPTGDLPVVRLEHHQRPFSYTGLDYFGPIDVAIGRRREKRYVALFTCLVVRAVHLELVHSLTTDSAIMALRRFMARRGCPQRIYSDNGTAFVGASREMNRLWQAVSDFAAGKKIEWHFLPPAAPFMAGVWERLVGTVKRSLAVILTDRYPKEEVLLTLLAEAESIVNSRPLTHVSVGAEDEAALTPNHFLIGSTSSLPGTSEPLEDDVLIGRSNWKKGLRLADHFWARWVREYLPTLVPRRRPHCPIEDLKIGDIVLIADGNSPRGVWPRGKIVAVFPGQDGTVRVADVATVGGTLRRPVRKLIKIV